MNISKSISIKILISLLVITSATFSWSDSLNEILRLTYTSNKQLVLTRARLASQNDAVRIASSNLGINISAAFNGSRDWDLKLGSQSDGFSGSLIGSYTISDGSISKNRILLEESILSQANHQLNELEQKVLLETINSYLNVLRDQKFVDLSKGNVSVLERQFQEIKDRYSLGEVTRTDVAQAESALSAARANLTSKLGSLAITSEIFLSQVGIRPGKLEPVMPTFNLPKNIELAKKRALIQHPRIMNAKVQEKLASIRIKIVKGEKKPLVSLKSSLSNGYNQSSGNYNSASIKLEGSIPIFNSGKINNKIIQAENNLKAEKVNTSLIKRSIVQEVAVAWSNLEVAKATIEARKRQVEASEIAYDGVVVEEKLGTRTTLNVINAEQNLLDARTQLASAQRDHLSAMFSVLAASGDLNINYLGIKTPNKMKELSKSEKKELNPFQALLKEIGDSIRE